MYTSSISVDAVIDALGDFLTPFVPGAQIVRGQVNRVAMPSNPGVVLTEIRNIDLSIPNSEYDPDNDLVKIKGPAKIEIQIDFYGEESGDFCKNVKSVFASDWGFKSFPENIKPLYMSDGIQSPLTTGEQQYESRWTATAALQYNPIVSLPQQFADEAYPNQFNIADI